MSYGFDEEDYGGDLADLDAEYMLWDCEGNCRRCPNKYECPEYEEDSVF